MIKRRSPAHFGHLLWCWVFPAIFPCAESREKNCDVFRMFHIGSHGDMRSCRHEFHVSSHVNRVHFHPDMNSCRHVFHVGSPYKGTLTLARRRQHPSTVFTLVVRNWDVPVVHKHAFTFIVIRIRIWDVGGMTFSNSAHLYLTGTSGTSGIAYENMLTFVIKHVRIRIVTASFIFTTSVNQA